MNKNGKSVLPGVAAAALSLAVAFTLVAYVVSEMFKALSAAYGPESSFVIATGSLVVVAIFIQQIIDSRRVAVLMNNLSRMRASDAEIERYQHQTKREEMRNAGYGMKAEAHNRMLADKAFADGLKQGIQRAQLEVNNSNDYMYDDDEEVIDVEGNYF